MDTALKRKEESEMVLALINFTKKAALINNNSVFGVFMPVSWYSSHGEANASYTCIYF
jgi:hypothetical protein